MIINTGGRDVVIDKLTVRGQETDWAKVFYDITTNSIDADLTYVSSLSAASSVTLGSNTYDLDGTTTDLTLKAGETMIVYILNPDSISINDIGLTVAITVFTSQAIYYKETNVQAYVGSS
jgi:hypothetical protein